MLILSFSVADALATKRDGGSQRRLCHYLVCMTGVDVNIGTGVDYRSAFPNDFLITDSVFPGEGVPVADSKALEHCDCAGSCSSNSRSCACVIRQRKWAEQGFKESGTWGFMYDTRRRLKILDYPIFECNDRCSCSDSCINRVSRRMLYFATRSRCICLRLYNKDGNAM